MTPKNERAIILGGGYTGLLAAKVLSVYFKEVVVIERDSQIDTENNAPRKGAPQGAFNHGLIPMGLKALEKLFPGFCEELVNNRAGKGDLGWDVKYMNEGVCKSRIKLNLSMYLMARPLIEVVLRKLLKKSKNVSFRYETDVNGLQCDDKKKTIIGVVLKDKNNHEVISLQGDLIVDATGPHSRSVEWLQSLGFTPPPIEEVKIDYIQIAYKARWRDDYKPDWSTTIFKRDGIKKGGYFMKLEDDKDGLPQWMFALVTHFGEPLEKDMKSYERLLPELENAAFYEAVKNATPLSEIGQYKLPKIRRKFFGKMENLPENFIVIGDAQCTWPPHAGLGLAVAAKMALELQDVLEKNNGQCIPRDYYSHSEKVISNLWNTNVTQGVIPMIGTPKSSLFVKFLLWYKMKLAKYSSNDPKLWAALLLFIWHEKPTKSLFSIPIIFRMILHATGLWSGKKIS